MQNNWQPLLEGEMADRAWQAIEAIAADIGSPSNAFGPSARWSLAGGTAGTALFFAYLAEATGDARHRELAYDHLEAALDGVAQAHGLGLWDGLLGVSWVFDHLAGDLFEVEDDDGDESDADDALRRLLQGAPRFENYDLIQGLAGFGVACLEGLPRPGARRALDLVLDHLLGGQERLETGISWWTPPRLLPPWQQELAPDGYYNLGVAHGVAAVVTLLARCIQASIRRQELLPLLDELVRWVLAQRSVDGFPSWVPKHRPAAQGSRLAWCYGDPGVAAALLAAAQATGRRSWAAMADEVAHQAATRDLALAGVRDAGLCHGSAGVAHLFHRLYRGTDNPYLAEAARHWFGHALDLRHPERGIGGFQAWTIPQDQFDSGELQWVDDPGLLTGSAGIGLSLLAGVTAHEPCWDGALLISAPSAEQVQMAA